MEITKFLIKSSIVILLLVLPYYIFEGKFFVGGDDTRLFYSFPWVYLKNTAFFSWSNFSTIGTSASSQFMLPFLVVWSILHALITDKIFLSYLAFSAPLIIGFFGFQKFVKEFFKIDEKYSIEVCVGSLFYVLSPILIFDQLFIFLTPAWLIGLFPIMGYLFLKYIRTGKFKYAYSGTITCLVFSFCLIAIPWILGLLLPVFLALIVLVPFTKISLTFQFIKRTLIFFGMIGITQAFWLFGFVAPYFNRDKSSFVFNVISANYVESFIETVNATASGSILHPLLNLFHRQIAFDFNWKLKMEFINLYDNIAILNAIYICVLFVGVWSYRRILDQSGRKNFLFLYTAFILSLFFFTVNIGPFKDLFLAMGRIPGFVMFRNFYDKFAPGYIFLYATLFTVALVITVQKIRKFRWPLVVILITLIAVNFSVVKSTVNSPLWTTDDIYKTIDYPEEYISFLNEVSNKISSSNTILSFPYGASVYSAIKDEGSDNVYLGVSPVKIFSSISDISGRLSFNYTKDGELVDEYILEKDFARLNNTLYKWNINYVIATKNLPNRLFNSYAYNKDVSRAQDGNFLNSITSRKLIESSEGNYELYSTKKQNTILSSKNLIFQKISPVKYNLYLKNLNEAQILKFTETYHSGWKLYVKKAPNSEFCNEINEINSTRECKPAFKFIELADLFLPLRKDVFGNNHKPEEGLRNQWIVDKKQIENNFSNEYYLKNPDGSIDIELELYFYPQIYFYYGCLLSFLAVAIFTLITIRIYRTNEKNN